MKNVIICEGHKGSIDIKVFKKMLVYHYDEIDVEVIPLGTKKEILGLVRKLLLIENKNLDYKDKRKKIQVVLEKYITDYNFDNISNIIFLLDNDGLNSSKQMQLSEEEMMRISNSTLIYIGFSFECIEDELCSLDLSTTITSYKKKQKDKIKRKIELEFDRGYYDNKILEMESFENIFALLNKVFNKNI